MREHIILAPGVNGNELIRNIALHGANMINIRIVNAAELANIALIRSGIAVPGNLIGIGEEVPIIAKVVNDVPYFSNVAYSDIVSISNAVRTMRTLVTEQNEDALLEKTLKQSVFADKNDALLDVYRKYMAVLSDNGSLDSISLVRLAIEKAKPIDAEFILIEEFKVNPLEKALAEYLSGGSIRTISINELYNAADKPLNIQSYKNCYGASNEVETIISDIYKSNVLDQCIVVVTDTSTYAQLFFDYSLLYDIPTSFGCGIPIINSNPAKLMVLYYQWMTGFFGLPELNAILGSSAFNKKLFKDQLPEVTDDFSWVTFYDVLGKLRLTNDSKTNKTRLDDFRKSVEEELNIVKKSGLKAEKMLTEKELCIPFLEVVARELALPAEDFIYRYSYIRRGSDSFKEELLMHLDMSAASAIFIQLKSVRSSDVESDTEDMITDILRTNVCKQMSEPGKLYVTSINGALTSVRDHLYVAGLSASKFPGSPREDYLLLDADLRLFGPEAEYLTADEKIIRKSAGLKKLVKLAANLGSTIALSYSGLNVSELKKDNASSLIYELYHEETGAQATFKELQDRITKVEYFEPAVSITRLIGEKYNEGFTVRSEIREESEEKPAVGCKADGSYSASVLEMFFSCPKRFMLNRIMKIPEPDQYDADKVIPANEQGTLAHSLLEFLANSTMSKEDFLRLSEDSFERYIKEHPPRVPYYFREKEQFLDMMSIGYDMENHREVVLKEEDIECLHESGVRIHGFPDRVEKLSDGSYLVVDFKSSKSISHVEDDIDTCLQIVLYAYLMEQKGFNVSGGEFRYIKLGETISCKYDEEMKDALKAKLEQFKSSVESGDFPLAEDISVCKYCQYGAICGINGED